MNMEALRRARIPVRSAFTKTTTALEKELSCENPNIETLDSLLEQIEQKGKNLNDLDKHILELLLGAEFSQEEYDQEYEKIDAYNNRLIDCQTKTRRLIAKLEQNIPDNGSQVGSLCENSGNLRKFKLPEIELKKFGGELKDWLGFWGQFQKIDSDQSIALEDKFQYLLQATIPKSKARQIVESFPPTAENYERAIEHLKGRFGKEDVLVEVYIRDLLRLVLNNAINPKQKVSLPVLYDQIETQLRALDSLDVASEKYAAMLYPLVESCLPDEIIRVWERARGFKANSTDGTENTDRLQLLMNFLREEVEGEERIKMARAGFGFDVDNRRGFTKRMSVETDTDVPTAANLLNSAAGEESYTQICIFCDKKHQSKDCWQAKRMSIEQKREIITKLGCCFLCLQKGHISRMCTGKQKCSKCGKRHYAIMCSKSATNKPDSSDPRKRSEFSPDNPMKDNVLTNQSCVSSVVLQTLKVYVRGKNSRRMFRALIDTGSQKSYIGSYVASSMGYESIGEETIVHSLFGGYESEPQRHHKFRLFLTSLDEQYHCNFEALEQPRICGNICGVEHGDWMKELQAQGIILTDSKRNTPCNKEESDVQILIGADIAGKLLTGEIHVLSCGLVAVGTRLGWTVMGKAHYEKKTNEPSETLISLHIRDVSLSDLWRLDRIGITDPSEVQTRDELHKVTYEHFKRTLVVNSQGRYEVSLPWLQMHPRIEDGYQLATKRLITTVKKLRAANIMEAYQEVFHSWLKDGVIEETTLHAGSEPVYYLPHRAVVKLSSTTQIRPVFDASSHEKYSPSLNSCLETGPNLLELIPSILTRFRMKRFGVVADIRKAFLQIGIKKEDRDFLRFLWHENGDPEKQKIYKHCRVVFGLTCSPFLLCATLRHHLEQMSLELSETAKILQDSFYVDNCVASLDNTEDLRRFIFEAKEIMLAAKFDLRGWRHNCSDLDYVENLTADEEIQIPDTSCQENFEIVPVLGLYWNVNTDVLLCSVPNLTFPDDRVVTKRKILSSTQRIFDPLGFMSPITLLPKLQLQECWLLKVTWDEELPDHLAQKFVRWRDQLSRLDNIQIPRHVVGEGCCSENLTLHVFADASKQAYATCIYLRSERAGLVTCRLIRAKSRVTPLKPVTIPRLELLACCIAARLTVAVKKDMHEPNLKTFFWSDSTNALSWIKRNENWAVFVSNRVNEIRALTQIEDWRHIPGKLNPADVPSRGCSVPQLIESKWWEGPEWLKMSPEEWPRDDFLPDEACVNSERRKTVVTVTNLEKKVPWYCDRLSSFRKIVRVIAWIYRFIRRTRKLTIGQTLELEVKEIELAELSLLKQIQNESFAGVKDPVLSSLQPETNEHGLIVTRTRLFARSDTYGFRCPIILPSKHPAVALLIQEKHVELSHAGIQVLMSQLRERYWVLQCRKTVRQIVKRCGRCRRFKAKHAEALPAPLPENRVREAAIFEIVGIDLGGPLILKGGEKTWFVLFTCAVFRAVHIELVSSLSTNVFLLSLRRFISRRGRPKTIYSDNGTNFVGAESAFEQINWQIVSEDASNKRIQWIFIPPTAAWWGGWWERLIRMIKEILRSVLGNSRLNSEELTTVLCEAEGVINNRPLTYLADDLDELSPLSPSLFLRELTDDCVPDIDLLDRESMKRRFRYRQHLKANLWKRFRTEYLGQLKHPGKTKKQGDHLKIGQVVLVGNDKDKRLLWPLARILELYPGVDGHVRVARLRMRKGEFLRPIQRLYPLELNEEQSEIFSQRFDSTQTTDKKQKRKSVIPVPPEPTATRGGRVVKRPTRLIEQ